MDLLIDAQSFQGVGKRRGIGRYSRELVAGIARVRPDWRVRVVMSDHLGELDAPDGVEVLRYAPPVPVRHDDSPTADLLRLHFADWVRSQRPDAVLVLSAFEGGNVPLRFAGDALPSALVFYDLIPLLFPIEYIGGQSGHWRDYARQLRQLTNYDAVLALSEASRRDVQSLVPCRGEVVSIAGAVGTDFRPEEPAAARRRVGRLFARAGLPEAGADFLFYVGGGDYRKNLVRLVEAVALLPEATRAAYPLVIAGEMAPDHRAPLLAKVAELGLGAQVLLTGYVTEQELIALYQTCRLLVFPSLYEGLGLPLLEAAACGADIACSDTSSMPEFAAPGTVFFDATKPEDMAAAVYRALQRPGRQGQDQKRAFSAQFSWEATAGAACRAVEAAVAGRRAPDPAAVTAWCRDFAADTEVEWLEELCATLSGPRGGRLALVQLPGDGPTPAELSSRVRVFAPAELDRLEDAETVAAHVYEAETHRRLAQIAGLLVRRPGVLIVPRAIAESAVLDDGRVRLGLMASDRVFVRGYEPGEPLPARFRHIPHAAPLPAPADFARELDAVAAVGVGAARRWRNAAVSALMQYPEVPHVLLNDWAKMRTGGKVAPRTPAPAYDPKEGRTVSNVPQKLLDLVGRPGKQLWLGGNPPFDFDSLELFSCTNFRAPAELHQKYDVVWCYEVSLSNLRVDQHLLALDELVRFLGAKGTLVLRFAMGASGIPVKNVLGRRPGLTARITHEEEDSAGLLICVVELERADIACYRPAPWTVGVLTQNTRKENVVALLRSVREQDPAGEHEVIICGPEDPEYAFAQPRYLPQNYSATLAEICRKKNDIAKAATRPNLLIVHDRYRLDEGFFDGFRRYGYDFDFLTVPQRFETGEDFPAYCHMSEETLRMTSPRASADLNSLRLTPFINGGLMIFKTHTLRRLPLNELCFWNQAEDVELTVTMMRHGIAPRFNPYSSATTLGIDKSMLRSFLPADELGPPPPPGPLAGRRGIDPRPAARPARSRARSGALAVALGVLGVLAALVASWQVALWLGASQ